MAVVTGTVPLRRGPRGTGLPYSDSCGRLHDGTATAATAEQLMRSRYSAFAVGDAGYLLTTWHPGHPSDEPAPRRPRALDRTRRARRRRWTRFSLEGAVELCTHYLDGASLP